MVSNNPYHKPVYVLLAQAIGSRLRCIKAVNSLWQEKHEETIFGIQKNCLPHGSGIDGDNVIDLEKSTDEKIIIHTSYHHMNEGGYYDGWTEHTITVRPSLTRGFDMTISGRDRNQIKEYLFECFDTALRAMLDMYPNWPSNPLDTAQNFITDEMKLAQQAYQNSLVK